MTILETFLRNTRLYEEFEREFKRLRKDIRLSDYLKTNGNSESGVVYSFRFRETRAGAPFWEDKDAAFLKYYTKNKPFNKEIK